MKISIPKSKYERNPKVVTKFNQLKKIVEELNKKKLPKEIVEWINNDVNYLNNFQGNENEFRRELSNRMYYLVKNIEKKLKIVPKKYYKNLWRVYGMAMIGIPVGIVFGVFIKDVSLSLLGIPLGFFIGSLIGGKMDKTAEVEDRQLNVEIR